MTIHLRICRVSRDFEGIPSGAAVLGLTRRETPWEHEGQCTLGVLRPGPIGKTWRSLTHLAHGDGAAQKAVATARARPGNVWVVTDEPSVDVVFAMAILTSRLELPGNDDRTDFVRRYDDAERLQRGQERTWTGIQQRPDATDPWLERGLPHQLERIAPAVMIVNWMLRTADFRLELAIEALVEWLRRDPQKRPAKTYFRDPKAVGVEAALTGDRERLFQGALQMATQLRFDLIEQARGIILPNKTLFDGGVTCIDLTGSDLSPEEAAQELGFLQAPVVVTSLREGNQSRCCVIACSDGYFRSEAFLLAAAEQGQKARWKRVFACPYVFIDCPLKRTSLTEQDVITLVGQAL